MGKVFRIFFDVGCKAPDGIGLIADEKPAQPVEKTDHVLVSEVKFCRVSGFLLLNRRLYSFDSSVLSIQVAQSVMLFKYLFVKQ